MERPAKKTSAYRFSKETKRKLVELKAIMDKTETDVLVTLIDDRHKARVKG